MEKKTIILIVIAILVVALAALGLYIANESGNNPLSINTNNILNISKDNNTDTTVNVTDDVDNLTNETNETIVGDNSPLNNTTVNDTNATYKVYNPQTDSYVPVIGEKYDEEVNRWYTYDTDGVRYYNTRIN
jgi:hypothetical protein